MDLMPKNWILLRGLAREKRHWANFPELVKKELKADHVYTLELPGVGQKCDQIAPNTLSDYANHLRKEWLTYKNDTQGDWGVIAISMGAMIAMNWCEHYPNDFKHLCVLNTSGGNLSPPHHRFSTDAMKMVGKLFFRENYIERERAILELTTKLIDVDENLVEKYASYSKEHPIKRSNFLKQLYAASRFKIPEELKTTLLILSSTEDSLANPKCSKTLAKHFNCPHEIHKGAGHDLPLDAPLWIINQIKSFFN